jgi:hypothetical protein
MIQFIEYKPEHYESIQDAVEPFSGLKDEIDVKGRGVAITATDGDVMACGGIVYTSETEGMVWVRISRKCKDNAFMWARTIKETFRLMVKSTKLKVFTYVIDDFVEGDRLARSIGLFRTGESKEHNGNLYHRYMVAQ